MTYLLDADWTADYLKGRPPAVTLLSALAARGLSMCAVTLGELYEGIYYGRHRRADERVLWQFLRGITVLPLSRRVIKRFALLRGRLRNHGQIIGDPDIWIAATAIEHALTLVTRNLRHFTQTRFPELTIYR